MALMFAVLAVPLGAQPADSRGQTSIFAYDKVHEIMLNGTVQEIVTVPAKGSPAGLHVLVSGPSGTVDAHLGPYVTKEIKQALKTGTPVEIVGAIEKVQGNEYLLARQLTFRGRQITLRSTDGLLLRMQNRSGHRGTENRFHTEAVGGPR